MMKVKILFMGTPHFASRALQMLVEAGFDIVGVITQPDKKVGRGGKIEAPSTKLMAENLNIPIYQPLDSESLVKLCKKLNPELIIVAAFGKKIPNEVLDIPKYKTLNIHGSLLPEYRGSSCIPQAILDGKNETGITIMEMSEEIDSGATISRINIPIASDDTTESLTLKLAEAGAQEIVRVLPDWINGTKNAIEQEHEKATFCKLIRKEDGLINWNMPAVKIERMIRAYTPWPNAYTFLDGKMIKIIQARVDTQNLKPGEILVQGKQLFIGTRDNTLEILRLKPENSKEMSASDFINGNKGIDGKSLTNN